MNPQHHPWAALWVDPLVRKTTADPVAHVHSTGSGSQFLLHWRHLGVYPAFLSLEGEGGPLVSTLPYWLGILLAHFEFEVNYEPPFFFI